MKKLLLAFIYVIFSITLFAQQRTLLFYQIAAHTNSPEIKENINLQKIKLLDGDIIKAQFQKPQVNFTADYVFAPFFFENGKFISITPNPSDKAIGYDAAITDGGLYAAQLNVSKSLFNGKSLKAHMEQNALENKSLQINQTQLQHDLEKSVNDQYITVYQLQQQKIFTSNTISRIKERLKIVEELVKKSLLKPSDYLALEVELSAKMVELKQQLTALVAAISLLNSLCGIGDTTIYNFFPPIIEQSKPLASFTFQEKLKNDSLTIVAQQAVSNSKYRPQLEIFGNTGLNSSNASTIPRNMGISAGVHLTIPIYDGRQKRIVEGQNKILLENTMNYKSSYTTKVKNELSMLSAQIKSIKETISLLDMQISKQNVLLSTYEGELAQGQISIVDYILALQENSLTLQNKAQAESGLLLLISQYNYINW